MGRLNRALVVSQGLGARASWLCCCENKQETPVGLQLLTYCCEQFLPFSLWTRSLAKRHAVAQLHVVGAALMNADWPGTVSRVDRSEVWTG